MARGRKRTAVSTDEMSSENSGETGDDALIASLETEINALNAMVGILKTLSPDQRKRLVKAAQMRKGK